MKKLWAYLWDLRAKRIERLEDECRPRFAKVQDNVERERLRIKKRRRIIPRDKKDKRIDFFY